MAITKPEVDATDYFVEDSVTAAPKHGTTVQAGWSAISEVSKPKRESGSYPVDFKFPEEAQIIRFLEDEPFAVYKQHWIDREGKKSFVALGEDDPLITIAGLQPRPKAAFNILSMASGQPEVQILTASVTLARQLQAANDDPRRGPLTKYYWAISRQGTGRETQYSLDRVRADELEQEWGLDPATIDAFAATAPRYDASAIYVASYEEHLKIARELVR